MLTLDLGLIHAICSDLKSNLNTEELNLILKIVKTSCLHNICNPLLIGDNSGLILSATAMTVHLCLPVTLHPGSEVKRLFVYSVYLPFKG
jgi:hypothetical protein